ncbi:retrotransposon protein, putative, ty1-copia subclass [Tanacetum coccineum]
MYFIEQPIPPAPTADSAANVLAEWNAVYDAHNEVACLMLGSMTLELHRQFENSSPYEMLQELKSMFEKQAGVESVGLILNGLTSDFAGFVRNYNMHKMGKTIGELHALLIEYEKGLPKKAFTPQVMAIQGGRIQKANKKSQNAKGKGKGKGKGKDKSYVLKPKNLNLMLKSTRVIGRGTACYLAELLKKKTQFWLCQFFWYFTIELFVFPNKSWVYDTGCDTHVCITKHGFREARKLNNEHSIYSKKNVHYFNAIPSNGIYEIDMHDLIPNVNSIYNVSTKRAKHNLDSTYLWHCHLAHINQGGEYISQEFKDYLKACGIVQQLTPPYTPQHNGVSERRNHTLLDMVRSIMNLTTLPLSFWDYA